MPRTHVSLRILSNTVPPTEITERLGVEPNRAWLKGDIRKGTKIVERENGWELALSSSEEVDFEGQLMQLFENLAPVVGLIKELHGSCAVQVSCVAYADMPPALNFSADLLSRMVAVNASLDIDLYLVPST